MNSSWSQPAHPGGGRPQGSGRRAGRTAAIAAAAIALAALAATVFVVLRPSARSVAAGQPVTHRAIATAANLPPLPASPLIPAHGALFGAYAQPNGKPNYIGYESAVTTLERKIGRKLAIDQLYVPWARPMPLIVASWDLQNGRIPMISWAGFHTRQILSGQFDARIRAKARHLRDLHGPVMLRWFAEMDGLQYRSLVASPASFIAAWRHIHNIFTSVGATNVSWIWCPNAGNFLDGVAPQFYPGSRYVNWICGDGYNWAPRKPGAPWKTVSDIFSYFYQWGARMGKPLMIGEFGVLERRPGDKGAWFRQTDKQLRTLFPRIKGVIYFNAERRGYNWRVSTSASSLAGFRAFADDQYFRARVKI